MKKLFVILGIISLVAIIFIVASVSLAAFQGKKMMPTAENFVDSFYQFYNTQYYSYIYNYMADAEFKRLGNNYDNFEKLIKWVYQKLGPVNQKEKGKWRINYNTNGTYFNIQYKTKREKGNTIDKFVLKKQKDGSFLLTNYNLTSQSLF